jgi:nitrate reductase assembly molybdenum cofactor insertion protein NarJ
MNPDPASFVLASVLASYPMDHVTDDIPLLLEDESLAMPAELRSLILERSSKEGIRDLQSEYIAIFDNGRESNPIYETEYDRRRAMAKGNELSDIAGFYKAFGFELDASLDGMEMLDHAGIEFEFYALMLMKQVHLEEANDAVGIEIVRDAGKKFLKSHLGRFIGSIARRPGVEASAFYGGVFKWCAQLVAGECKRLELEVIPADWVDGETIGESEMNCGLGGGCNTAASPAEKEKQDA